ncbi:MAG: maleylacetate reductase [Xanthobacteraceae bacterium]
MTSTTISRFTYRSDPIRIVFGAGAIGALAAEADFHKMSRLVVLCSASRLAFARRVTASVADRCCGFCDAAEPNMPRTAFEQVLADLKRHQADGFVVVGGGSPIGLAKAAAATTGLPYIAVVTTQSGSEMAARWRIGVAANRITGEGPAALPATAIYDPELTLDLPPRLSAASGMNAMAHAVESLYGIDTNPVVQTQAEEAIRLLGASLPRVLQNPRDLNARTDVMYGAWLAANFRAETGLEHAIAQRVRQWFELDHAHTHAVATPYAIGFNADAAPGAMARIERALGVANAARGLYDLNVRLGLPTGLKGLGLREADIGKAVDVVAAVSIDHPKPVSKADLFNIIAQAYAGAPPRF